MVDLVPNPDGCAQFAPNAFKKEKCKNCGRPWFEHLGVITDDIVQGYQSALRKAAEEKQKAEEEAKAKAKAKQMAKKKQAQAVEDEWLFDGPKGEQAPEPDSGSDDDMGFKMFTPEMMDTAPVDKKPNKPLKVVNLIDFGECDVPEEQQEQDPTPGADSGLAAEPSSSSFAGLDPSPVGGSGGAAPAAAPAPSGGSSAPPMAGPSEPAAVVPSAGRDMDLLTEIQHLRQMLADANEEKSIQVAIVRDEVVDKQQLIDQLTRQRGETQAALQEARSQLEAMRSASGPSDNNAAAGSGETAAAALPAQERLELEQYRGEVERLRTELGTLREFAAEAEAKAAEADRQLEAVKASVASAEADAAAAKAEAENAWAAEQQARKELEQAKVKPFMANMGTEEVPANHAEAHAVAQEMGRQAAQALRDIRLSAEQQLAWLSKRMRDSHHADFGAKAIM